MKLPLPNYYTKETKHNSFLFDQNWCKCFQWIERNQWVFSSLVVGKLILVSRY